MCFNISHGRTEIYLNPLYQVYQHRTPRLHSAHSATLDIHELLSDSIIAPLPYDSHNRESRSLDKTATAEAHRQDKLSLRNEPLLRVDIPVAEITTHKLEIHSRPLASGELDLFEATQLLRRRAFGSAVWEVHVQLRDSGTTHIAGVSNSRLSGVENFPERGIAARLRLAILRTRSDLKVLIGRLDSETGKLESGVGEAETKLIANVNFLRIEVAVVDLKLLVKVRLPIILAGGIDVSHDGSIVVGCLIGDRIRQVARRVHITIQNVDDGVA